MSANLIDYWSYSSMASLLNNPMAFKKTYILKQYDNMTSPSALVGSAVHKTLEMYFKGLDRDAAILEGQKLIDQTSDMGINYGKTGTRAGIVADFNKAINFAFEELPKFHELLGVEESITTEVDSMVGGNMGLPAKAKMDIVARNEAGELEITDWKTVRSYTDGDVDDFKKWLQGMFNYYVVKAKYGEAPKRIIYREIKLSANKDHTPQMQAYVYEFSSHADFATFERLYADCTRLINSPDMIFLPNPGDMFDGQATFELYRQGIMGVERPVAVPHKTEQVKFAEKQYVASASDKVENKDLSMEERIRTKLQEFGIAVQMEDTFVGASVTQYTMKPSRGIPMRKIAGMERDLALALEAHSLRVEAPIPGSGLVGVEVPSAVRKTIELTENHYHGGTLDIPIGVNVHGETIHKSLADMPHLLIAGATGSGKSVMLNVILQSLTHQLTPQQMQLVLIDPKQVELAAYSGDPHLRTEGIITQPLDAVRTLAELVKEMESRYRVLAKAGARSISDYKGKMPVIVTVIDEFADLMMSDIKPSVDSMDIKAFNENLLWAIEEGNGKLTQKATKKALKETLAKDTPPSAEESIIRIAQKARAVGIHLILATQRPSADVVTGLIKANIPTKIAFMATSQVNSKIVLDQTGAEELTGKGDMLFADPSATGLQRLQGLFV